MSRPNIWNHSVIKLLLNEIDTKSLRFFSLNCKMGGCTKNRCPEKSEVKSKSYPGSIMKTRVNLLGESIGKPYQKNAKFYKYSAILRRKKQFSSKTNKKQTD